MGFRSLFKVRRPGNGDAFQKKAEAAGRAKIDIANKGNAVGAKTSVKGVK